jgi:hypothetical protein
LLQVVGVDGTALVRQKPFPRTHLLLLSLQVSWKKLRDIPVVEVLHHDPFFLVIADYARPQHNTVLDSFLLV